MSKILIDNKFTVMNYYSENGRDKKFSLSQLKMIWYLISETNKELLKYKFEQNEENILNVDNDMDIDIIQIDKKKLIQNCFGYRMSDKKLYELLSKTDVKFLDKENLSFYYLFQDGKVNEDTVDFLPTKHIFKLLHCDKNHFQVKINDIMNFKSINSLMFYQLYKANQYIITKYKRKLVFPINFLQEYFLTKNRVNDLISKIIKPSLQEYRYVTGEKIKSRTIKLGTMITSIELYK